jgi:hypothetical protein
VKIAYLNASQALGLIANSSDNLVNYFNHHKTKLYSTFQTLSSFTFYFYSFKKCSHTLFLFFILTYFLKYEIFGAYKIIRAISMYVDTHMCLTYDYVRKHNNKTNPVKSLFQTIADVTEGSLCSAHQHA